MNILSGYTEVNLCKKAKFFISIVIACSDLYNVKKKIYREISNKSLANMTLTAVLQITC